ATTIEVGKEKTPIRLEGDYQLASAFNTGAQKWDLSADDSISNISATSPGIFNKSVDTYFTNDSRAGFILTLNPTAETPLAYQARHLAPHMLNLGAEKGAKQSEIYKGTVLGDGYEFSASPDSKLAKKDLVRLSDGEIPVAITQDMKGVVSAQSLATAPGTTFIVPQNTQVGKEKIIQGELVSNLGIDEQGMMTHDFGTSNAIVADVSKVYKAGSTVSFKDDAGKSVEMTITKIDKPISPTAELKEGKLFTKALALPEGTELSDSTGNIFRMNNEGKMTAYTGTFKDQNGQSVMLVKGAQQKTNASSKDKIRNIAVAKLLGVGSGDRPLTLQQKKDVRMAIDSGIVGVKDDTVLIVANEEKDLFTQYRINYLSNGGYEVKTLGNIHIGRPRTIANRNEVISATPSTWEQVKIALTHPVDWISNKYEVAKINEQERRSFTTETGMGTNPTFGGAIVSTFEMVKSAGETTKDAGKYVAGRALDYVGGVGIPVADNPGGGFRGFKFSDTYNLDNLAKWIASDTSDSSSAPSDKATISKLYTGPLGNQGRDLVEQARSSSPLAVGIVENIPTHIENRLSASADVLLGSSEDREYGWRVLLNKDGTKVDANGRYRYLNPYTGAMYDKGEELTTGEKIWGTVQALAVPVAAVGSVVVPGSTILGAGLAVAGDFGYEAISKARQDVNLTSQPAQMGRNERLNTQAMNKVLDQLGPEARSELLRYEEGNQLSKRVVNTAITGAGLGATGRLLGAGVIGVIGEKVSLAQGLAIFEALTFGVPNVVSLYKTGEFLPADINIILAGAGAATPLLRSFAGSAIAQESAIVRLGYSVAQQGLLWGQVEVTTGQVGSMLGLDPKTANPKTGEGRPLTLSESLETYGTGVAKGSVFGLGIGLAGAVAASPYLSNIINTESKTLRYTGSFGLGAVALPAFSAGLTTLSGEGTLLENLEQSYTYENMLAGGLAGLGIAGLSEMPAIGNLSPGASRLIYGALGGGTIKTIHDAIGTERSGRDYTLGQGVASFLGGAVIGGLAASYKGAPTNLSKGLVEFYNNPAALADSVAAGALKWIYVSPSFTVGSAVWKGTFTNIENLVEGKPLSASAFAVEGRELLTSAVYGPRSGVWMAPSLSLVQVQKEASVSPSLVEKALSRAQKPFSSQLANEVYSLGFYMPGLVTGTQEATRYLGNEGTYSLAALANVIDNRIAGKGWTAEGDKRLVFGKAESEFIGWFAFTRVPAYRSSLETSALYKERAAKEFQSRNYENAAEHFSKAVELNPNDIGARVSLGLAKEAAGIEGYDRDFVEAKQMAIQQQNFQAADGIEAQRLDIAGRAAFKGGMPELAAQRFEQLVKLTPVDSAARFNLGLAKEAAAIDGYDADFVKAKEMALGNQDLSFADRIEGTRLTAAGRATLAGNMPDLAAQRFEQAIKIDPADPMTHFGLGLAKEASGIDGYDMHYVQAKELARKQNNLNMADLIEATRLNAGVQAALKGGMQELALEKLQKLEKLGYQNPSAQVDLNMVSKLISRLNVNSSLPETQQNYMAQANLERVPVSWVPTLENAGTIEQRADLVAKRSGFKNGAETDQIKLAQTFDEAMRMDSGAEGFRVLGILEGSKGKTASILISLPTVVSGNMREGKTTIILVENPTQGQQFRAEVEKVYGDVYKIGYIGTEVARESRGSILRDKDIVLAEISELASDVALQKETGQQILPMERIKDARVFIDEADSFYTKPAHRITQGVEKESYAPREMRYQEAITGRAIEWNAQGKLMGHGDKTFDLTVDQYTKNFSDLGYSRERIEFDLAAAVRGASKARLGEDYQIGHALKDLSGPENSSNMRPDIQILEGSNTAKIRQPLHAPEAEMNVLRRANGLEMRPTSDGGSTFKTEELLKLFSNIGAASATASPVVRKHLRELDFKVEGTPPTDIPHLEERNGETKTMVKTVTEEISRLRQFDQDKTSQKIIASPNNLNNRIIRDVLARGESPIDMTLVGWNTPVGPVMRDGKIALRADGTSVYPGLVGDGVKGIKGILETSTSGVPVERVPWVIGSPRSIGRGVNFFEAEGIKGVDAILLNPDSMTETDVVQFAARIGRTQEGFITGRRFPSLTQEGQRRLHFIFNEKNLRANTELNDAISKNSEFKQTFQEEGYSLRLMDMVMKDVSEANEAKLLGKGGYGSGLVVRPIANEFVGESNITRGSPIVMPKTIADLSSALAEKGAIPTSERPQFEQRFTQLHPTLIENNGTLSRTGQLVAQNSLQVLTASPTIQNNFSTAVGTVDEIYSTLKQSPDSYAISGALTPLGTIQAIVGLSTNNVISLTDSGRSLSAVVQFGQLASVAPEAFIGNVKVGALKTVVEATQTDSTPYHFTNVLVDSLPQGKYGAFQKQAKPVIAEMQKAYVKLNTTADELVGTEKLANNVFQARLAAAVTTFEKSQPTMGAISEIAKTLPGVSAEDLMPWFTTHMQATTTMESTIGVGVYNLKRFGVATDKLTPDKIVAMSTSFAATDLQQILPKKGSSDIKTLAKAVERIEKIKTRLGILKQVGLPGLIRDDGIMDSAAKAIAKDSSLFTKFIEPVGKMGKLAALSQAGREKLVRDSIIQLSDDTAVIKGYKVNINFESGPTVQDLQRLGIALAQEQGIGKLSVIKAQAQNFADDAILLYTGLGRALDINKTYLQGRQQVIDHATTQQANLNQAIQQLDQKERAVIETTGDMTGLTSAQKDWYYAERHAINDLKSGVIEGTVSLDSLQSKLNNWANEVPLIASDIYQRRSERIAAGRSEAQYFAEHESLLKGASFQLGQIEQSLPKAFDKGIGTLSASVARVRPYLYQQMKASQMNHSPEFAMMNIRQDFFRPGEQFTKDQALTYINRNENWLTRNDIDVAGLRNAITSAGEDFNNLLVAMNPVLTLEAQKPAALGQVKASNILSHNLLANGMPQIKVADKPGMLKNDTTDVVVPAQVSMVGGQRIVNLDPAANFIYTFNNLGELKIHFNLQAQYHSGIGAHENLYHPAIASIKDNLDAISDTSVRGQAFRAEYGVLLRQASELLGKPISEFNFDLNEWQENELLTQFFSLKDTLRAAKDHAILARMDTGRMYSLKPQAGGFFTYAGKILGAGTTDVNKIIEVGTSLSNKELLERIYTSQPDFKTNIRIPEVVMGRDGTTGDIDGQPGISQQPIDRPLFAEASAPRLGTLSQTQVQKMPLYDQLMTARMRDLSLPVEDRINKARDIDVDVARMVVDKRTIDVALNYLEKPTDVTASTLANNLKGIIASPKVSEPARVILQSAVNDLEGKQSIFDIPFKPSDVSSPISFKALAPFATGLALLGSVSMADARVFKAPTTSTPTFDLVVGSFTDKNRAVAFEKRLQGAGYEVYRAGYEVKGKKFTRVIIDLNKGKDATKAEVTRLKQKGLISSEPFVIENVTTSALPEFRSKKMAGDIFDEVAKVTGMPAQYTRSVAGAETDLRHWVVQPNGAKTLNISQAGAIGIMQIMPIGMDEIDRQIRLKTPNAAIMRALVGNKVDRKRVKTDVAYNVKVGSAKLYIDRNFDRQNLKDQTRNWERLAVAMYNVGRNPVVNAFEKFGPTGWLNNIGNAETLLHNERLKRSFADPITQKPILLANSASSPIAMSASS
ncbi:MAG: hypothetical protein COX96_05385, partial [Candidatus Omnitrophica bacterium CG_4_10_14_0_2_um_filter_44_9]